ASPITTALLRRPRKRGKERGKVRPCNGGNHLRVVFGGLRYIKRGPFSLYSAFDTRRQELAASSNGQDAAPSRLRWEFDSPRCYQEFVCLHGVNGGAMPGRSMVGRESLKLVMSVRPPQHAKTARAGDPRSIRSPAARFRLN